MNPVIRHLYGKWKTVEGWMGMLQVPLPSVLGSATVGEPPLAVISVIMNMSRIPASVSASDCVRRLSVPSGASTHSTCGRDN